MRGEEARDVRSRGDPGVLDDLPTVVVHETEMRGTGKDEDHDARDESGRHPWLRHPGNSAVARGVGTGRLRDGTHGDDRFMSITDFSRQRRWRAGYLELAPEPGDQVEHEREQDAEHDGSDDRKITRGVLAAVDDVAGKPPDRQVQACAGHQEHSKEDQQRADKDEELAEAGHWNDCMRFFIGHWPLAIGHWPLAIGLWPLALRDVRYTAHDVSSRSARIYVPGAAEAGVDGA